MSHKTLIVERDVEAKMRDGVILRADVYRPNMPQPAPVLLLRTPYGKAWTETSFALTAAERGYAVVIQDTRGRWASDGDGYPFIHEMNDGYDSVEWAAHQPWANGKVGMFGLSYMGYTQLAAAVMQPPSLKTIIPNVTFCDAHAIMYHGGALALGVGISWNLMAGAMMAIMRHPGSDEEKDQLMGQLVAAVDGMALGQTFDHLPLSDMPLIGRDGLTRFLADCIAHPTPDDYWQRLKCPHKALTIPIFHIGGWYDIFIGNTPRDFAGIHAQGNARQKMMIGPWVHGSYDAHVGEVDFGLQASGHMVLPEELHLRWFDYWLRGIENGIVEEPPIHIFVMGDDCWHFESEWPLARTQYTPYYLHSGGAANSLHGDGSLTPERPLEEPVDSFVYDPRNPVPTRGGGLCCWRAALPPGAFDQRQVEARPDVLVYTTPPLEYDVEVTGPIEVHLWAATSAPDTDFTAKLVDVGPGGYARNVQDGIVRARYRESPDRARPVTPGQVYEYVIDLSATSNVFKAGHCIRVEISSSNFPRFNRNPNTGHPIGDDAELRTALQTILHDAAHPSHIVLPIIPRG
jgi:putative CocE/NonD family hydrolase